MTRRGTPEADLQRTVVQALRVALPRSAIIHHCANEVTEAGPRGAKRQAILVGMGVHPGFADLTVLCAGRVLFLELKSLKGRLSPAQEAFREAVTVQGVPPFLIHTAHHGERPPLDPDARPGDGRPAGSAQRRHRRCIARPPSSAFPNRAA